MGLLEQIQKDIKETLSEGRYNHSIGVMNRAAELAKIYGEDIEKAKLIGISHDIAKEMSKAEKLQYIKENNIYADEVEMISTPLLHGKIGADIVKNKYGFDTQMQKAIIDHTTTSPDMDNLSKILYLADKTEEGRTSKEYDIAYERDLANTNIDEAILYIIDENLKNIIKKGKIIHPKAVEERNKLIMNLKK